MKHTFEAFCLDSDPCRIPNLLHQKNHEKNTNLLHRNKETRRTCLLQIVFRINACLAAVVLLIIKQKYVGFYVWVLLQSSILLSWHGFLTRIYKAFLKLILSLKAPTEAPSTPIMDQMRYPERQPTRSIMKEQIVKHGHIWRGCQSKGMPIVLSTHLIWWQNSRFLSSMLTGPKQQRRTDHSWNFGNL